MGKGRCDVSTAEHAYASLTSNKDKNTAVKTAAKPILSQHLFLWLLIPTEVHVATSHVTPLCSSPSPNIPKALSSLDWNGMY